MKIPPYVDPTPKRGPSPSPMVAPSRGGTAGRSLAERDRGRGATVKPSSAGSGTAGTSKSDADRPARAAAEKAAKRPPAV
jgi:hypothetical protein